MSENLENSQLKPLSGQPSLIEQTLIQNEDQASSNSKFNKKRINFLRILIIINLVLVLPTAILAVPTLIILNTPAAIIAVFADFFLLPFIIASAIVLGVDYIFILIYLAKSILKRDFTNPRKKLFATLFFILLTIGFSWYGYNWYTTLPGNLTLPLLTKKEAIMFINNCNVLSFSRDDNNSNNEKNNDEIHIFFEDQGQADEYFSKNNETYTEYTNLSNWNAMVDAANNSKSKCGTSPIY